MWRGGWVDGGVVARLCAGGSFRWQCWSCSACLRLFVVVVWLVFVGGLGGIATIGAALRCVAGVSGVYGSNSPRLAVGAPDTVLKLQTTSAKNAENGVLWARWTLL